MGDVVSALVLFLDIAENSISEGKKIRPSLHFRTKRIRWLSQMHTLFLLKGNKPMRKVEDF
jgi:hypothetical protein